MKVGVIGSRSFADYELLKTKLLYYLPKVGGIGGWTIVSGGAKGADSLAALFADEYKLPKIIHLPNYEKYGRQAPLTRNDLIIKDSQAIIAFWDGESRGTLDSIKKAINLKKDIVIVPF